MKKRALSILLALVLLLGLIPVAASAESEMAASEACVEMIKKFEGFCKYPYKDYSQYTVGYGTRCPDEDLERYMRDGITEEEAEVLLRSFIASFEASVNRFIDRYELTLTQNQFDALVSFTYNFGASWTMNDSTFRSAVLDGATGNDFLFAITQWCTADGEILPHLADRRLIEANMYLNGEYNTTVPVNYQYVTFEYNGAPKIIRIQGYDASEPCAVRPVPTLSGYRFLGWYTANEGGRWITELDATTDGITLYARWQEGDGPEDSEGYILGTPAQYQRIATAGAVVRDVPSLRGEVRDTLNSGSVISVVADFVDANSVKWGQLAEGGWVNLSQTKAQIIPAQKPVKPDEPDDSETPDTPEEEEFREILVTVTNEYVNVRSGAGTGNAKVRQAMKGEQLLITETKQVGSALWGRFADGWISLEYTNYNLLTEEGADEIDEVIATGVVTGTWVNIRNGAGTSYPIVGSYLMGDEVEILRRKTVGVMEWGRTEQGWVCLDYVELTPVDDTEEPEEDTPAPEEDAPTVPEEPENNTVIAVGTVINCTVLRVRADAGTAYEAVGTLNYGDSVEIYETATVQGMAWGRISGGWICLTYVRMELTDSGSKDAVIGVVNTNGVNVRSGAGTHNARVGTMNKGDRIEILQTTTVYDYEWGMTAKGWIRMDFVDLVVDGGDVSLPPDTSAPVQPSEPAEPEEPTEPEVPTQPETPAEPDSDLRTGTIVKTESLRVRSGAGTHNAHIADLAGGTRVTIYETATVNGTIWGRVDAGWISLYYVELDAVGETTTKIVIADALNVRSGAGTNYSLVGSYLRGTQVEILETTTVGSTVWGRTSKGWISLDYVI